MQELVNAKLVPVWIDIRSEPVPPLPDDAVLVRAKLDANRFVQGWLSEGFFVRSLVISPDGKALLNPQDNTPEGSMTSMKTHGYFCYAQVKADDYLKMLGDALGKAAP